MQGWQCLPHAKLSTSASPVERRHAPRCLELLQKIYAGLCINFGKSNQLRLTRLCSFHQRRKSPAAAQYARMNASTCQEVDRGGLMS